MKMIMLGVSSLALVLASMNVAMAGLPPTPVPEPSTLAVLAVGVVGAVVAARMRNKK